MVTLLLGPSAVDGQESGSDTFGDVPAGHWGDQAIGWAVANGITQGVGEGGFDPDGTVTRAQIVAFLYRTFHLVKGNPITAGPSDGTIGFASDRDGDYEVYLMNADGSNVRQLTDNTRSIDWLPTWSPDGTRIAFASDRDGDFEIFLMNPDGADQLQLTHNQSFETGLSWSPDGTQIAFTSDMDGDPEVFVMNVDGTGQRQLTYNSHADGFPSWSPDGTRVAFHSERDGDSEIFVMNPDGTNQRQLTHNDHRDRYPSWSPDGARIAFTRELESGGEVILMAPDGSGQQRITFDQSSQAFLPSWSPDGSRIVYTGSETGQVFVIDADGTNRSRISDSDHRDWTSTVSWSSHVSAIGSDMFSDVPARHWAEEAIGWAVSNGIITGTGEEAFGLHRMVSRAEIVTLLLNTVNLAADRQTEVTGWNTSPSMTSGLVAFTSDRYGDREIFVTDLNGANLRRLTNSGDDADPSWSPDGTQLAFVRRGDIFVMDADGSDLRQLTRDHRDRSPSWSPDGARITFAREVYADAQNGRTSGSPSGPGADAGEVQLDSPAPPTDWQVFLIDVDGTNLRQLTHNRYDDWAPSWSPDGARIAFASNRDGDPEVFVMNADGTLPRQLTANTTFDTDPRWSPDGARIAFTSYRDGDAEVFVMAADGTNLRQLTANDLYDAAPDWSPDGTRIAFQRWGDRHHDVYLMNADGTGQRKVTGKSGADFFGDVPQAHPANQAIGWAATHSITSGVGKGRFGLDGTVTRAQIVTFLHRTANLLEDP